MECRHKTAMEGIPMAIRRRRSARTSPLVRVIGFVLFLLGAYFGRDFLPVATAPAGTGEGVLVERVVDGDTLVISGGERVRLIGVDTPETKHPNKPPEPFGSDACEFTRRMVEGKRVQVEYDPGEKTDRYGRTLAYVYIDGHMLNEQLLIEGLARALTNYPFSAAMKDRFRAAEAAARLQRRGIWSTTPSSPTLQIGQQPRKRAG
jgi:micrococcal nuclease